MVARGTSSSATAASRSGPNGVVHLVGVDTLPRGAACVALMLRRLRDCGCLLDVQHAAIDQIQPQHLSGAIVVVGADSQQIDEQVRMLRRLHTPSTLSMAAGSNLDAMHALLLRECGATTIVDSIATAQAAARLVQRFLAVVARGETPIELKRPWPEAREQP